jgi:REP element-mobilizing transposase RayT
VVETLWQRIPRHFPHVRLDEWVVMPNHLHGIIVISDGRAA